MRVGNNVAPGIEPGTCSMLSQHSNPPTSQTGKPRWRRPGACRVRVLSDKCIRKPVIPLPASQWKPSEDVAVGSSPPGSGGVLNPPPLGLLSTTPGAPLVFPGLCLSESFGILLSHTHAHAHARTRAAGLFCSSTRLSVCL